MRGPASSWCRVVIAGRDGRRGASEGAEGKRGARGCRACRSVTSPRRSECPACTRRRDVRDSGVALPRGYCGARRSSCAARAGGRVRDTSCQAVRDRARRLPSLALLGWRGADDLLDRGVRYGAWVAVGLCGLVGSLLEQRRPSVRVPSVVGPRASWPWPRAGFLCCLPTERNSCGASSTVRLVPRPLGVAARGEPRSDSRVPRRPRSVPSARPVRYRLGSRMRNTRRAGGLRPPSARMKRLFARYRTTAVVASGVVRSLGFARARAAPASVRNATWLILPVVICLSQRLSHACVSMN